MLKECNLDPSETIHRLLNQDTFHKVKSKREKKKETKDSTESRLRIVNITSNRGGRSSAEHPVRTGATQVSSNYGGIRSKSLQKKENGPTATSSGHGAIGGSVAAKSSAPRRLVIVIDYVAMENVECSAVMAETISSQYSSGVQRAWPGMSGQRTLADIVKMGRPLVKTSGVPFASAESYTACYQWFRPKVLLPESYHMDPFSNGSMIVQEPSSSVGSYASHDDWPLVHPSSARNGSSHLEAHDTSAVYTDQSTSLHLHADDVSLHCNVQQENLHSFEGNINANNLAEDSLRTASASERQIGIDSSAEETVLDHDSFRDMNSYQSHGQRFESHEVSGENAGVSLTASALQRLNLDSPGVIFPNNLQIANADCSHLSFGSFGSGVGASFPESFSSLESTGILEVPSEKSETTSLDHSDARNSEYNGSEQLRSGLKENDDSRPSTNDESFEMSSLRPDGIRTSSSAATEGLQYSFEPSVSGYTLSDTTEANSASYASVQENSQMQNISPFSGIMEAYTSSSPSNLLASAGQPSREFDLAYSNLLATQSMPTKYSMSASSMTMPSVSMLEKMLSINVNKIYILPPMPATKLTEKLSIWLFLIRDFCSYSDSHSGREPSPHNLPSTSIPAGSQAPQQVPVQAYSQPTLPLGHFANIVGYPFLHPQSYTYLPSAFQQAYPSSSTYSKYALPQQYKAASAGISNLPPSAAPSSFRGGFGGSQYKEASHYLPLQQNESSAMWLHGGGGGSRTMPAVPGRSYYSFQGQGQDGGLRQSQQQPPLPPPYRATAGYQNLYHAQMGLGQEQRQGVADGGSMNPLRGPSSQATASQLWQHY
ncbi:unnamed protein product [Spirodela intermedia]|uniref:GBF-interacting protein 1 N-terminal domain-containing protein n=1 Tax=Spirodela intermedia TaxID=51605 RepID=A0A7I8J533_SPIIN|nr:unnamed protein product [Spirodela intermedia]CAA6665346.1 unnamed protein product [Spirodela intermedia]